MSRFNYLTILLYTFLFLVIGTFSLSIAFNLITLQDFAGVLEKFYALPHWRIISGLTGMLLILISFSVVRLTYEKIQREKTIAFNNPDGPVMVSLPAIENYLRRILGKLSELHDVRADLVAKKKGINIICRVNLWAGTPIPEITERIQSIVKKAIQDMLGIEELIIVRVQVIKLLSPEEKRIKEKDKDKGPEPIIPFRNSGY